MRIVLEVMVGDVYSVVKEGVWCTKQYCSRVQYVDTGETSVIKLVGVSTL